MAQRTPTWPSLYNPGLEVLNIQHRPPIQPGGSYLYNGNDVFRFTFYWSLLMYTPAFLICGAYAFWNYTNPPSSNHQPRVQSNLTYELVPSSPAHRSGPRYIGSSTPPPSKLPRINERRSRAAFAAIIFLLFVLLSVAGCVLGSAVLGFVMFGLFKAADFHMSTWIPFLLAALQTLAGLLSVWPSIIEII